MTDSSGEKQFAPTERRLQEARQKGQIPIGRDLLAAAAYGGLALAVLIMPSHLQGVAKLGEVMIEQSPELSHQGIPPQIGAMLNQTAIALAPLLLLPAGAVLAMLFAQQGLVFAGDRIRPKLSRLSVIDGVKRRFGLSGLMEFAKSAVKLLLISALLANQLSRSAAEILASVTLDPRQATLLLGRLIAEFVQILAVSVLVIGLLDLLWQRFDHLRKLRMTRKELTEDMKQSEGDPHLKAQRRRRAEEIATRQMIAEVPKANVVIVNPEHYAVALQWKRNSPSAPICVAKGVDELAARIRAKASETGVPIRRDPPVARALHATVEIGEQIRTEHYRAVAAAIRYAEDMRKRAAHKGWGRRTND